MQIAHHGLHPRIEHVGIDLRRRNIGMAEQFLHDAQIGAVLQKMAGEGVAQHMRADPRRGDPGLRGYGLEIAGKNLPAQMAAGGRRRGKARVRQRRPRVSRSAR